MPVRQRRTCAARKTAGRWQRWSALLPETAVGPARQWSYVTLLAYSFAPGGSKEGRKSRRRSAPRPISLISDKSPFGVLGIRAVLRLLEGRRRGRNQDCVLRSGLRADIQSSSQLPA